MSAIEQKSEHPPRRDRNRRRASLAAATLALTATATACGHGAAARQSGAPTSTVTTAVSSTTAPAATVPATATTTTPTTTTQTTVAPTTTTVPPFQASVATVTAADLPHSWRPGCPVSPAQLRLIRLSYWGFDNRPHAGAIVVNETVVAAVTGIFQKLYEERFNIMEMVPVDAYGGSDDAAAAADDTSGFNCRDAVTSGPPQWSVHAYGEAIDVNDVQNPYVEGGRVIPPAGAAYVDRSVMRPGMAVPGGALVGAFAAAGWQWGGRWSGTPDYQHFSATGG